MKKKLLLSIALLGLTSSFMNLTSCGSSEGLTIVHFDQTILGDAQKDLSVSIGIKKGRDELKTNINNALNSLTTETRNELMLKATTRSTALEVENEEGKEILTTAPYDSTKSTLTIGLECDYSPFNWTEVTPTTYSYPINGVSNQYADGYDIQIAKYLASTLDMNLVIKKIKWESLIPSLENNSIDLVIAGMTDTEERRLSIDFTDPYYTSELVLVVKKNSELASATSLEQFKGKKFVSQVSTVTDSIIDDWVVSYEAIHLTALDTFSTCAIAVRNGTADVMTAELPVAQSIVNGVN